MKRSGDQSTSLETPRKMAKSSKSAGIVQKICLENFLCHDKLEMEFNEQINFIIGKNGSGKSAVLTGIVVALGERASATSRGQSMKDFVKTGKQKAVVKVTLLNRGQGAYRKDLYGNLITIERSIQAATGTGSYRILNEQGKLVSNKRSDLNRILAKMNLQVDNPVCILNQETAKNFLHSNNAQAKYKLFERATQMDVMHQEFSSAEDELSRSKSCMKEKVQSLELLKAEVQKWRTKKEWYEAINEIHEKRDKIENEIAWAQVEDHEKVASEILTRKDNQKAAIDVAQERLQEQEDRLTRLIESVRSQNDDVAEKAKEIHKARAEADQIENQAQEFRNRLRELNNDLRQLDHEKKRSHKDKEVLEKEIDRLKKAHGESEFAREKERRIKELEALRTREQELSSLRKVTDHQVEQLKGALTQLRNDAQQARSELARVQQNLGTKSRTLGDLQRTGSNSYVVYGNWVPTLLQNMERTRFRGTKPKGPLGAFIKLRDQSWAPVVEAFFGGRLNNFICSNDEDLKTLNRMLDEVLPRGKPKPQIITASMTGQMHDVSRYKVECNSELQARDIHCLMDMLIIEDVDVANILIDMATIEQVLLIGDERDASFLLSDANKVPHNCKSAITKEGNTYYPDPNYRSYSGKAPKTPQFLQASVEDAIRNLQEDVNVLKQEEDRIKQNLRHLTSQIQNNECQLRSEESKLTGIRRDATSVTEKIRTLETEKEPEPTDVLALEEDLLEAESKLEKYENEMQIKTASMEELKQELAKVLQAQSQKSKIVTSLLSDTEPLKDSMKHSEMRQREMNEKIEKLKSSLVSMQAKLKGFEDAYEEANKKAETMAASALELVKSRVPVTKSLKQLNAELRRITEQVAAQEKEYGSREYVLSEYRRRRVEFDQANSEVCNLQRSLKKMDQMARKRKDFIVRFRNSIEIRTHFVFQSLLKTRNFEGEIRFDPHAKSLTLMVTPPGREEQSSQPNAKRSRVSGVTDICSLSGGERSFATVCFILSLWDAIESPFRILDEFDVFMDHVNRKISMDLLVNEARDNAGRQFIFLTPLGLEKENLRSVDDISIFKMSDPDRREEEASS